MTVILEKLLAPIAGVRLLGDRETRIGGIAYDSRKVKPGDLFVAIRGERTHGALFIPEAVRHGAAAVASDETIENTGGVPLLEVDDARLFLAQVARVFWGDPASELRLVAVTGTNGKTTTIHLVDAMMRAAGLKTCMAGTLGMRMADRLFPSARTTPESADLASFLREAVSCGCTHGALEVSSHALALRRVYGMKFATGVFTNLTPDHLDFHGDMESYFRAKCLLFSAEGGNRLEAAVVNADDPFSRRLEAALPFPAIEYGFQRTCAIHVLESRTRIDGTDVRLATPDGELRARTRLPGRPNIYNIMAATGAALTLGLAIDAITRALETVAGIPGRMELVQAGQPYAVIVDYAHTPDALEKLLETVAGLPHREVITVFGCGGDRDRTKRPVMGRIAVRKSDHVIVTSDNPRTEDPLAILEEIRPGLEQGPASFELIPDRREAIGRALSLARADDAVIIAGKGHETYQSIGSETLPFDDRAVAREWILRLEAAERA
jgi:UDP-N-acetylmuramoyl-L-alanyl-D-glutamate--2,6-diaminopimelate ligase